MPTSWALTPTQANPPSYSSPSDGARCSAPAETFCQLSRTVPLKRRGVGRTNHEQAGDVVGGPGCFQLPATVHPVLGAVGRGVHARGSRDLELLDDVAPVGHVEPRHPERRPRARDGPDHLDVAVRSLRCRHR